MPAPSEFEIQRAVCMWLDGVPATRVSPARPGVALPDVLWFHCPNGGARNAIEGKRFKDTGVKAGIFDLTFLHQGGLFVLELKKPGGELSAEQRAMWPRYHAAGARGIAWADNLASAKAQIISWGLVSLQQPC